MTFFVFTTFNRRQNLYRLFREVTNSMSSPVTSPTSIQNSNKLRRHQNQMFDNDNPNDVMKTTNTNSN